MPLYRFHCNRCQEDFRVFLRLSEEERGGVCPKCREKAVDGPSGKDRTDSNALSACGLSPVPS